LDLSESTDVYALVDKIVDEEPLISSSKKQHVFSLVNKLLDKLQSDNASSNDFYLFRILRTHILPLTNCTFNKSGDKFITGSYDRTCKVWDTATGDELHSLEGHTNVVYSVAFNNPYGDKVITGSFDRTCKVWDIQTGECIHTLRGHDEEVVCLSFNPQGTEVLTGSMDFTARLYDVETGQCIHVLAGHTGEIVSVNFNSQGNLIATGSFDYSIKIWDSSTGKTLHTLNGHRGEISCTIFSFSVSARRKNLRTTNEHTIISLTNALICSLSCAPVGPSIKRAKFGTSNQGSVHKRYVDMRMRY
jgi:dynein assembly factor with WDR repeat domains 1